MVVFLFIQAIIVGWFCSYVAGQKNREQGSWFLLGFLFSFLALIALAAIPTLEKKQNLTATATDDEDVTRKCPFCAEIVKREAIFCRFCQHELPAIEAKSSAGKTAKDINMSSSIDAPSMVNEKQIVVEKKPSRSKREIPCCIFKCYSCSAR